MIGRVLIVFKMMFGNSKESMHSSEASGAGER